MTAISNVRIESATKLFGAVRGLASVSLEISSGEVVAIMGANGAGKSTLLGLLSLRMRPTRGDVLFNGRTADEWDNDLRQGIGLLSHEPLVYPDLTARENLELFARLGGVEDVPAVVDVLERQLGLERFAVGQPTRVLSRGQLQRVALARALVTGPDLLLLDEPAAGLDSDAVSRIERVLGDSRRRGKMAVIVTHEPVVAQRVATRAVMMSAGRIVADVEAPRSEGGWRDLYLDTVGGKGP